MPHASDYAVLRRPEPGGWEDLAEDTLSNIIAALRAGKHGSVGSKSLFIEGVDQPIFGKALAQFVEEWRSE